LLPGDHIFEVENQPTDQWTIEKAVSQLKGIIGTKVNLKVRRKNGEVRSLTIERGNVQVETVVSHVRNADGFWNYMLDDEVKIGYVRISSFSAHTTEELRSALETLKARGMRALVLDLRFNPGGLLTSAIEISDMFLVSGEIVSTAGRNVDSKTWSAKSDGTFDGFAMVVLVNQNSASASEIVSASLQDNGRATIIGQRTWGKGSVQKIVELEGGRSALRLTTASFFRPNGKNIHRFKNLSEEDDWGVRPDPGFEVRLSRDQSSKVRNFQQLAILLPGEESGNRPILIDAQLERALSHLKSQL